MPNTTGDEDYANIRQLLGDFVGKKLVDITQHDQEEWEEYHESYIQLMFEDGTFIRFPVTDEGFDFSLGKDE